LVLLLLTSICYGQVISNKKEILILDGFQDIKTHFDTVGKGWQEFDIILQRELLLDFWEYLINLRAFRIINEETKEHYIHNYKLKFLATNNRVFYYNVYEIVYNGNNSNIIPLDSNRNEEIYNQFKSSYFKSYGLDLDEKELFLPIIYGESCGIGGIKPAYRKLLDSIVINKDLETLQLWLTSANTEKQIYALKGIKLLSKVGFKPNKKQEQIIDIIKNKEGYVYTCSGCIYFKDSVKSVIDAIEVDKSQNANNPSKKDIEKDYILYLFLALFTFFISRNLFLKLKNK